MAPDRTSDTDADTGIVPPDNFLCPHSVLEEVDGLFGYYRCRMCGHFFHLQVTSRHTPQDFARMAHWMAIAATAPLHVPTPKTEECAPDGVCRPAAAT